MSEEDYSECLQHFVVRNHEEQYSIWRTDKPVPAGWEIVGESSTKAECLARITVLWTDMRPASLRRSMNQLENANEANI